jgi:DNA-directed RNA polymerase subunit M/transcription elongation factor TFIIS
MTDAVPVLEYKCPCCGAGLVFGEDIQKMTCEYCDNTFELETVRAYNEASESPAEDVFTKEEATTESWTEAEAEELNCFTCPACGGEIVTDENTAATFCPFCDNPAILSTRLSGGLKPDAVIPFSTSKEDAQNAFRQLCKGKPLLPKNYAAESRVEKITGIYVPYWLYDCDSTRDAKYKATRIHRWSDSRYIYTRTDHFLLERGAGAAFQRIPMDGSSKLDDAVMESIEPFDYSKMTDFDTAYLSGFFADKYDVEASVGDQRVKDRVGSSMDQLIAPSLIGYATAVPYGGQLTVNSKNAKYVLLPVWFLHTKYKDKSFIFAMNGQSGKMTGTFPICPKRSFAWFAGICAAVTAIATLIQCLAF